MISSSGNEDHSSGQVTAHQNPPVQTDKKNSSSYQPPVFADDLRLTKIKNALPAIQNLFQAEFTKNHFPGLVYGIVVDGELLDSYGFGYIDVERKIPSSTKSLFRIASMTKSFTAMAIVKLRDDGHLRLDDSVEQYIPEFQTTNLLTSDAPIITIRHLLTQDAGMPEDDPWGDQLLGLPDDEFLKMLQKGATLSNPPGTVWEYTNLAFAMLGRIITVASGVAYQEYIQREILRPLGMTSTFWEYSEAPSELLARGYRWECERYSEEELMHDGSFGAMGGLISSIDDFHRYLAYHLQAWPARDEPEYGPLRRSSIREMHRPWNFIELGSYAHRSCSISRAYSYGLVWCKDRDGVVSVNHTGGLPGFGSNWVMLPEHGIGLVSFANSTYADLGGINAAIMDQIAILADLKSRQLSVPRILAERREQIIKLLLENKWNIQGSNVSMIFAENFFRDTSLDLRKTALKELLDQAGPVIGIEKLVPKNQLRGHFDINGANISIRVFFSLSPENPPLIQELKLSKVNH